MRPNTGMWNRSHYLICGLATLTLLPGWARGQDHAVTFTGDPILPRHLLFLDGAGTASDMATGRAARFQMFRMPAAFLYDPIGLDSDDDPPTDPTAPASAEAAGDLPVGVAFGFDNPFFDVRLPGDPGGVGYQRVHTQYQVIGDRCTCLCLGFQAYVPAGPENDGLATGPTIISPHLALFHEWENGLAVQGFLGKSLAARAGWTDNIWKPSLHCGVGLQSPFPWVSACSAQGLHWFVEALGSVERAQRAGVAPSPFVGVIPGVHWRLRDNWWMSSGVVLPVGTTRYEAGQVQITCSWRF